MAMTAKRACYGRIRIESNVQEGLPEFSLPQTELQQVLLNLVNNALDAMEKTGGRLSIHAGLEEDTLILEVSDTGPGIPKEDLPRLFDPFFTTKPVGKGTGLGLSICYGIIKRIGGGIRVDTQIGRGSTFRVTIPISKDGQAGARSAVELPGFDHHPGRPNG
jgi:two-component system NtrC family sensor kinase